MTYSSKTADSRDGLRESLEKAVEGLGLRLLDLAVFQKNGRVQVKLTVYKGLMPVSIDDCARAHRAVLPRLELAFGRTPGAGDVQSPGTGSRPAKRGQGDSERRPAGRRTEAALGGLFVEVSSPGIDRLIKEGSEFVHFTGRELRCFRTDISDWTCGMLVSSDKEGIVLKTENGEIRLAYETIGKAKLSRSGEKMDG